MLNLVEARLPLEMRNFLDRRLTKDDMREDLFQMSLDKALGIDGFLVDFFQRFWDVVGDNVSKFCLDCLNEGRSVESINHSLLCLIPKVKTMERMTAIRPISLFNIIYKCVSKALANRF